MVQVIGWELAIELGFLQYYLNQLHSGHSVLLSSILGDEKTSGVNILKTVHQYPEIPVWQRFECLRMHQQLSVFRCIPTNLISFPFTWQYNVGSKDIYSLWNQIQIPAQPLPTCVTLRCYLTSLGLLAYKMGTIS